MYMCTIILVHGAPAAGKSSLDHPPQGLPPKDTKKHLKSTVLFNVFVFLFVSEILIQDNTFLYKHDYEGENAVSTNK